MSDSDSVPTLHAYVVVAEFFRHSITPEMHLRFGVLADDASDATALVQEQLSQGLVARASGETLPDAEVEALGLEPYRPRLLARG